MNRSSLRRIAWVALLLAISGTAAASTIRYTYAGLPFDELSTGVPAGITAASGYVDIEGGLAANLSHAFVTGVTQFNFTDGVSTVTSGNFDGSFQFSTDNSGNISWWRVSLDLVNPDPTPDELVRLLVSSDRGGGGGSSIGSFWYDIGIYEATPLPPPDAGDDGPTLCVGVECVPANPLAQATTPGTWTQAVIPLPASAWLFLSALSAAAWRRRAIHPQSSRQ